MKYMYDSAYSTVDVKTKGIICNLFNSSKISQKQGNGEVCALFAIANATLIANGINPCSVKLIDHLLQTNLTKCFNEGINDLVSMHMLIYLHRYLLT